MIETGTIILLAIFSLFFLIVPFAVNAFYQRRAARFTDALLAADNAEFNRQVKTNAVILLVRRILWGLFVLSGVILNFRVLLKDKFSWPTVFVILIGIACFAFGVRGYRNELKRLKL